MLLLSLVVFAIVARHQQVAVMSLAVGSDTRSSDPVEPTQLLDQQADGQARHHSHPHHQFRRTMTHRIPII